MKQWNGKLFVVGGDLIGVVEEDVQVLAKYADIELAGPVNYAAQSAIRQGASGLYIAANSPVYVNGQKNSHIHYKRALGLIAKKSICGDMTDTVRAAAHATENGLSTIIFDGKSHGLLYALKGKGTKIYKKQTINHCY